jgi:exopolysaccharide production protein ExoQ
VSAEVALLVCGLFILWALIIDFRQEVRVSVLSFIPLIWLAILGSRPVSQWLHPGQGLETNPEEGSVIDSIILLVLMFIGAWILVARKLNWAQWLRDNLWICLFFLYCGLSIFWSDFPLVAFKRWIRAIGSIIIILVIHSETNPVESVVSLVRRCAYVLIPLSVVLIKYYRDVSVRYDYWSGKEYIVGITTDKNGLGRLCMIVGLFLFWEILTKHNKNGLVKLISILVFILTFWLLLKSNSSTSLGSFMIGCCLLIWFQLPIVKKRVSRIGAFLTVISLIIVVLEVTFDLIEVIVTKVLGRNMTLTDRTYIWEDLLKLHTNPFFGVGYDSFWLGERLHFFLQKHNVDHAHNGFLAIYLELGVLGLLLFACFLFASFWKARTSLLVDFDYGRFRMTFLFVFLLYNVTEVATKITTLLFFIFLLVMLDAPRKLYEEIQIVNPVHPSQELSGPRNKRLRYNKFKKPR